MIHLTNDAVQKFADDYGKFEAGNKLSYTDFQNYLDKNLNNWLIISSFLFIFLIFN
jgi:tubulin polyglutamylase TTLL1/tubulin monoglycylase TTLL3/8